MAIVDYNIGLFVLITHHPETLKARLADFMPRNRRLEIAMAQCPEPEERESDTFGEEDLSYFCRYLSKCIADAANDKVLEW